MTKEQRESLEGIVGCLRIDPAHRFYYKSMNVGSTKRREAVIAAWQYILKLEAELGINGK